ncbi:MAG: recombination mediator RecR [Candidatus Muirbacterium halophilum]|nr:recombination mediator RecR [Candidatus Muirbacterium halophilum]MCK9477223.1 recombination mediator RecR [Candidatus Muirbacterium halophilum]
MSENLILKRLVSEFSKLPSVGKKTAQRLAYYILSQEKEKALALAYSIIDAREKISFCENCFNYTDNELCDLCQNNGRKNGILCVVESPREIEIIESTREFFGRYHVLHGLISPLKGISPNDIRLRELIARITKENIEEVIIALDFSVEADATSLYISRLLKPSGINITRLAPGIPAGASLEYADTATLTQAIKGRISI